jgi:hypothetical protein
MTPLLEKCSMFKTYYSKKLGKWCFDVKHPETVSIIDFLQHNWQSPELSEKIRSIDDKHERDVLKKQLWGLTPGSIMFGGRGEKYVIEHSGLMAFDIDKIDKLPMTKEQVPQIIDIVNQIPYTVYAGRSASGRGVWGLFRISNTERYADHFKAMELQFLNVGIEIDPAPRSIASLRFISQDPQHYLNENAKIFNKVVEPIKKEVKQFKVNESNTGNRNTDGIVLIAKFNSECSVADIYTILVNYGFNFNKENGDHYYFTRPDKDVKAGISIDYHANKRTLYSFSSNTPGLEHWKTESAGWSCSPLTALRLYGFGGVPNKNDSDYKEHWAKVFKYIKSTV